MNIINQSVHLFIRGTRFWNFASGMAFGSKSKPLPLKSHWPFLSNSSKGQDKSTYHQISSIHCANGSNMFKDAIFQTRQQSKTTHLDACSIAHIHEGMVLWLAHLAYSFVLFMFCFRLGGAFGGLLQSSLLDSLGLLMSFT